MTNYHHKLEKNSILLLVCTIVVILIGGLVEIVPLFRKEVVIEPVKGVRPYTPLELAGFNVYIREGCYNCHSQQIRPLRDEVERYGHYSLVAESIYDHPFQWGSKRTGPDLARVGGKYSDEWHTQHLNDPKEVVPESIMPAYPHLLESAADFNDIQKQMAALRLTGVPYTDDMIKLAKKDVAAQAWPETENAGALRERYGQKVPSRDFDGQPQFISEMDALVAYLQVLGTMAELKDYDPALPTELPESEHSEATQ